MSFSFLFMVLEKRSTKLAHESIYFHVAAYHVFDTHSLPANLIH